MLRPARRTRISPPPSSARKDLSAGVLASVFAPVNGAFPIDDAPQADVARSGICAVRVAGG